MIEELVEFAKELVRLTTMVLPSIPDSAVSMGVDKYYLSLSAAEHTAWYKVTWIYQYQPPPLIGPATSLYTKTILSGTVGNPVASSVVTYDPFNPGSIGRQNRICDYSGVLPSGEIDPLKFSLTEYFVCRVAATIPKSSYYLSYLGGYASVMISFKNGTPTPTCSGPGTNTKLHSQDDIGPIWVKPSIPSAMGVPEATLVYPQRTSWEHISWASGSPHGEAILYFVRYGDGR